MRHPDSAGSRLIPTVLDRETDGESGTRALGQALGALLAPGDLVLLEGGLGAGKTVFVQGLAKGLGLLGAVKSPTFTLVHEHHRLAWPGARADLAHLDLYRLPEGASIQDLALDEFLERGVVAVEWGARLAPAYPEHFFVTIEDRPGAGERRRVRIEGHGPAPARRAMELA